MTVRFRAIAHFFLTLTVRRDINSEKMKKKMEKRKREQGKKEDGSFNPAVWHGLALMPRRFNTAVTRRFGAVWHSCHDGSGTTAPKSK